MARLDIQIVAIRLARVAYVALLGTAVRNAINRRGGMLANVPPMRVAVRSGQGSGRTRQARWDGCNGARDRLQMQRAADTV